MHSSTSASLRHPANTRATCTHTPLAPPSAAETPVRIPFRAPPPSAPDSPTRPAPHPTHTARRTSPAAPLILPRMNALTHVVDERHAPKCTPRKHSTRHTLSSTPAPAAQCAPPGPRLAHPLRLRYLADRAQPPTTCARNTSRLCPVSAHRIKPSRGSGRRRLAISNAILACEYRPRFGAEFTIEKCRSAVWRVRYWELSYPPSLSSLGTPAISLFHSHTPPVPSHHRPSAIPPSRHRPFRQSERLPLPPPTFLCSLPYSAFASLLPPPVLVFPLRVDFRRALRTTRQTIPPRSLSLRRQFDRDPCTSCADPSTTKELRRDAAGQNALRYGGCVLYLSSISRAPFTRIGFPAAPLPVRLCAPANRAADFTRRRVSLDRAHRDGSPKTDKAPRRGLNGYLRAGRLDSTLVPAQRRMDGV
ncbi:hypothetical protein HYPSUDRAFT_210122 [Hypholoma sublateritium FD-334 SS-4]|uniref:Uncharacterized protein n=1 Tax=Hypholoma sublateritium (strain FD-334 SS-4) TaxID=945553 RepID=A0A0D2NW53_HYPSF|nr:hypothetical protein HYPSUDRAFT_210122 [Hypholoma sublateritium FD-334 SS-4]